jgi:hypothetical protein
MTEARLSFKRKNTCILIHFPFNKGGNDLPRDLAKCNPVATKSKRKKTVW